MAGAFTQAGYEGALVATPVTSEDERAFLLDCDALGELRDRPVPEQVLGQLPGPGGPGSWSGMRNGVSQFRLSSWVGDGSRDGPEGVRVCRSVDSMPVSPVILAR